MKKSKLDIFLIVAIPLAITIWIINIYNWTNYKIPSQVLFNNQLVTIKCLHLSNQSPKYIVCELPNGKKALAQKINDKWAVTAYEP